MLWLQHAGFGRPADQVRSPNGRGLNGIEWFHAPLHHLAELPGIVAVRIHAGIRAESDLRAGLKRVPEILALQASDFLLLLNRFWQHPCLCSLLQNEIVVVDVEYQVRAV